MIDFGLGGIPIGDFVIAIVMIIAVMLGYWYFRARNH